jgi:predicted nuclease of predicted toxin-antitoxin system
MKLLFDQNVSPRLVRLLSDLHPGSVHLRDLGFGAAADPAVWDLARDQGFMIVSKDSDFDEMATRRGHPPKVIWLRCGNSSTDLVHALIRRHYDDIVLFALDEQRGVLWLT